MRSAPEGETPVNPYSLLEAVNDSSDTAHVAWLIFISLMAYLMVAVAGVTHKDLLLETPVTLPILQVNIQQVQFFQFAPIILLMVHLGLVSQLVLLARKTLEFDHAVRLLETTNRRTHPLRLELHNFFFVQAMAGPHRSIIISAFLHGFSWLTLVVLPVILILYIQIKFLPYHDVTITWMHRITLLFDILMLVLIGVFLARAESSFFSAFARNSQQNPVTSLLTAILLLMVTYFSLFVATIPGERIDQIANEWMPMPEAHETPHRRADVTTWPIRFFRAGADGRLFGFFPRNLVASDLNLAPGKEPTGGETTISLRGRDLRFAVLDRSDLRYADLTGANLDGSSLIHTDLRGIRFQCADIDQLILTENRVAARCSSAEGANFTRAILTDAKLAGANLRGAKFEEARLEGAELRYALMTGANFAYAHLERADLSGGTQLQGANFLLATLQGADLHGAQLQFADFTGAHMQGAVLAQAGLHGGVLRDADLEAADLTRASLFGSDMTGARLRGADLRGAAIWMTEPPLDQTIALADLSELIMRPLDKGEVGELQSMLERISNPRLKTRLTERLAPVMAGNETRRWAQSGEQQRWQQYVNQTRPAQADTYNRDITDFLAQLSCKQRWSNAAIATGIAKRAQSPTFRGNPQTIYDKIRADDCPASKSIQRRTLQTLSTTIDTSRGN